MAILVIDERRNGTLCPVKRAAVAAVGDSGSEERGEAKNNAIELPGTACKIQSLIKKYVSFLGDKRIASVLLALLCLVVSVSCYFATSVSVSSPWLSMVSRPGYVFDFYSTLNKLDIGEDASFRVALFIPTYGRGSTLKASRASAISLLPPEGSQEEHDLFALHGQTLYAPLVQRAISSLVKAQAALPHGSGPEGNWVDNFLAWVFTEPRKAKYAQYLTQDGFFDGIKSINASLAFDKAVGGFLRSRSGRQYRGDVWFQRANDDDEKETMKGIALSFYQVNTGTVHKRLRAMKDM